MSPHLRDLTLAQVQQIIYLSSDYCYKKMIFILPSGKSYIFAVLWNRVALHKGSWLFKPHS